MQAQGVIEAVSAKTRNANTGKVYKSPLYSFLIDNDWYGCGWDNPNVEKGDNVTFNFDVDKFGKQVQVPSIVKSDPDVTTQIPGAGAVKLAGADNRQLSIVYQSSRKDAIQFMELALSHGLVTLPKAKQEGYDAVLSLVNDLTVDFAKSALTPVLEAESAVEVIDDE